MRGFTVHRPPTATVSAAHQWHRGGFVFNVATPDGTVVQVAQV